jgi:hypothetical protein
MVTFIGRSFATVFPSIPLPFQRSYLQNPFRPHWYNQVQTEYSKLQLLGYGISRQRDWKKMMDGDVSHSSEFKLFTLGVEVGAEVVCISISFPLLFFSSFYFTVMFTSYAFIFIFFLTSGASSPEWVKPTAEGGGLLVIYVLSYLRWFCDFIFLLYFRFLFCPHSHYG